MRSDDDVEALIDRGEMVAGSAGVVSPGVVRDRLWALANVGRELLAAKRRAEAERDAKLTVVAELKARVESLEDDTVRLSRANEDASLLRSAEDRAGAAERHAYELRALLSEVRAENTLNAERVHVLRTELAEADRRVRAVEALLSDYDDQTMFGEGCVTHEKLRAALAGAMS